MQNSQSFSLNKNDLMHIGRHFLFAALAAGIGYLLTFVLPNLNVTGTAAILIPIITALLTSIQSYLSSHS